MDFRLLAILALFACEEDKTNTAVAFGDADTDSDADTDTDTDATPTGDTGTTLPASYLGTDFAFAAVGDSPNCVAKWEVSNSASSYACPYCKFSIGWQFDVTYTWDPTSVATGCKPKNKIKTFPYAGNEPDAIVYHLYQNYAKYTGRLNTYYNWWGYSPDAGPGGTPVVLAGEYYAKGRLYVYPTPVYWDVKTGAFSFEIPYDYSFSVQATGNVAVTSP